MTTPPPRPETGRCPSRRPPFYKSDNNVVEILSADRKTAAAAEPLVVALRQLAGESVRASTEVLEVAADVRKCIEETRAVGRSSRPSTSAP